MDTKIPNRLSVGAIQGLKDIYEDEFGDILTDDQADEMGKRLLKFFAILLIPEKMLN